LDFQGATRSSCACQISQTRQVQRAQAGRHSPAQPSPGPARSSRRRKPVGRDLGLRQVGDGEIAARPPSAERSLRRRQIQCPEAGDRGADDQQQGLAPADHVDEPALLFRRHIILREQLREPIEHLVGPPPDRLNCVRDVRERSLDELGQDARLFGLVGPLSRQPPRELVAGHGLLDGLVERG
jgi:hypothetical protein